MKTFCKFRMALLLILLMTSGRILAYSSDSIQAPDTSKLITFNLFQDADPFQSDDLIRISLEFNMKKFIRTKRKNEYHEAILRYIRADETATEKTIRIRARGEFRKNHCYFPPIKLNFKKAGGEEAYMNDIKSLKLVTHCKNSDLYQQYILKEYLVYKMFNILTGNSYRVRLFEIDYIDSEGKMKTFSKYGFIIESHDYLAKRLDAFRIERKGIPTWLTEPYQTNLMAFFQFMIGNTDWAIANLHNIRLFKTRDHRILNPLAIPYDFDYCGMVNTYYAFPDERLGIESVRERVYRGYCFDSEQEYQTYIRVFLDHKKELFALVENFGLLDKNHKKEMLQYLDEYFVIIENQHRTKREIIDQCRSLSKY